MWKRASAALTAVTILVSCALMTPAQRVAWRYGVPVVEVERVAAALGVDPNKIEKYGGQDDDFPASYYVVRYMSPGAPPIRRSELIKDLKGYMALCRDEDTVRYSVMAFFYSIDVSGWTSRQHPLVMAFIFRQPIGVDDPDPPFIGIRTYDLSEPDINPGPANEFSECMRLRRINTPASP